MQFLSFFDFLLSKLNNKQFFLPLFFRSQKNLRNGLLVEKDKEKEIDEYPKGKKNSHKNDNTVKSRFKVHIQISQYIGDNLRVCYL